MRDRSICSSVIVDKKQISSTNGFVRRSRSARDGSALVLGLLLSIGVIGLTAVTMDLGYIRLVQTELRRSADAVAMAGCWELFEQVKASGSDDYDYQSIEDACNGIAASNSVGEAFAALDANDLHLGHFNVDGNWSEETNLPTNAVRVTLRRESSTNGELPLFFGAITGRSSQGLYATATAAMFYEIDGFYEPESGEILNVLPIALDLETWISATSGQTGDELQFTENGVQSGSDGVHEANLYPQGTGAPGNRGTVDIGGADNSTNDLSRQVLTGISRQDIIDLGKSLEFDENGELELNGDTGISAGIKNELASLIGKTRIIPIYSEVVGNGNNAMFKIVRWEGVRILDVKLTGKKESKRVIVQPQRVIARHARVDYTGSHVSSHLLTPVLLVE